MKCTSCGHENSPDEEFCDKCGRLMKAESPPTEEFPPAELPPEVPPGQLLEAETAVGAAAVSEILQAPVATEILAPAPAPDPNAAEDLRFHSTPDFPVTVSIAGITHIGLASGKNNEDAFAIDGLDYTDRKVWLGLLGLTDGVGGGKAGEVIAKQAVYRLMAGLWFLMPSWDQMKDFTRLDFWRFARGRFERFLYNQVVAVNGVIRDFITSKNLKDSGATLITAAVLCDLKLGRVDIRGLNLGDTRAYLITNDRIEQLSTDQVIGGNPTSYLGAYDHVMATQWTREIWMGEERLKAVSLLLCSDGLWNMLSPNQIAAICRQPQSAQENLNALIAAALSIEIPYGRTLQDADTKKPVITGDDNLTAILVQITA